jgi:hypothetical protein
LALPDREHPPTQTLKGAPIALIAIDVVGEFPEPEPNIGLRRVAVAAPLVSMPEAAVYEDNGPVFGKYNIRLSRKACAVKSESQALTMKPPTDNAFGDCVSAPDAGHHAAASWFVDDVRQYPILLGARRELAGLLVRWYPECTGACAWRRPRPPVPRPRSRTACKPAYQRPGFEMEPCRAGQSPSGGRTPLG